MMYNQPGHPVHENAKEFSKEFERKLVRMTKERKKRTSAEPAADDERLQEQMLALQSQITDMKKQVNSDKERMSKEQKRSHFMVVCSGLLLQKNGCLFWVVCAVLRHPSDISEWLLNIQMVFALVFWTSSDTLHV